MTISYESWSARLRTSILALSRTASGVSDATHEGKPELIVQIPQQLPPLVAENLNNAMRHVWDHGLRVRSRPPHVRSFCNVLSLLVSAGLLSQDQSPLRTWSVKKFYPNGIPASEIKEAYPRFCEEVAARMLRLQEDPVAHAAWVEREFDAHLHPLADGCGRVAKLLGAWMLLRAQRMPAFFTDRQAYYEAMEAGPARWEQFYRAATLREA